MSRSIVDEQRVHDACAELRFAEGLRRRSEEARAESTVREAAGLALLEGARVDPELLRSTVRESPILPQQAAGMAVAVGAWKAAWGVFRRLPRLNPGPGGGASGPPVPLRQVLADMQREYGSELARVGIAAAEKVTLPKDPQRWSAVLAAVEAPGLSALRSASRAWALLALEEPFFHGSQLMGVLAAKWILASRGVEPTGVSVLSAHPVADRAGYERALGAIRAGDWHLWEEFFAAAIVKGAEVGQLVARHVQAGKPG